MKGRKNIEDVDTFFCSSAGPRGAHNKVLLVHRQRSECDSVLEQLRPSEASREAQQVELKLNHTLTHVSRRSFQRTSFPSRADGFCDRAEEGDEKTHSRLEGRRIHAQINFAMHPRYQPNPMRGPSFPEPSQQAIDSGSSVVDRSENEMRPPSPLLQAEKLRGIYPP